MSSNFDKHLGKTIFYIKNLRFIQKKNFEKNVWFWTFIDNFLKLNNKVWLVECGTGTILKKKRFEFDL